MHLRCVASVGTSRRCEGSSRARNVFHFSVSYDDQLGIVRAASRSRFSKLLFVPHRSPQLGESAAFSFVALLTAAKFLRLSRGTIFMS